MKSAVAAALTTALALALGGCGVPIEDGARKVTRTDAPVHPTVTPAPTTGAFTEKLFLVQDGRLIAVERKVPIEPDADMLLLDLIAGPTQSESDHGLTSALLGTSTVTVRVEGEQAVVELSTALESTGRTDDVLAFGQLVCTLTSRSEIHQVVFTRRGEHIGVPNGDGVLTLNPLTQADYASLID